LSPPQVHDRDQSQVTRSGIVESWHRGSLVVLAREGSIALAAGTVGQLGPADPAPDLAVLADPAPDLAVLADLATATVAGGGKPVGEIRAVIPR
jgi:hypothetical protein